MFNIPYGRQSISDEDIKEVIKVLKSNFLTTGPKVKEFEEAICKFTGTKYSVAVSNGTSALHISSLVLLNKEDKVLTTPNSFLATSNSILYARAKPIFVDICEDGGIDLDLCEEMLKKDSSIKAIYVVSFSGKMQNQERLKELKQKYNLTILEDHAHSLGASWQSIKAGSCYASDVSTFSFHPVKNITTGEGGAVTTNSKEIYEKLLTLRNHGIVKTPDMASFEYEMRELGFNYRLTDFQAVLGLSQLKKLDEFLEKRKEIAKAYHKAFQNSSIKPLYPYDNDSAYHLFVVKVPFENKKELFEILHKKGIKVQLHYLPINRQPYYKTLGYGTENIPIMDKYYKEAVSLPIYPTLKKEEQEFVIKTLKEIVGE